MRGPTRMNEWIFILMAILFIGITLGLGYYGFKQTRESDSFLLGNRKMSPTVLALSYGATFLSASAIVGFGGQAAKYGLSMVWLVFLNLFVGLIVAFIIFGKPTRKLGQKLKAFTFSDLLGKRYNSDFIRLFAAVVILVGMPIYCAAVMLGGVNFLDSALGIDRNAVLIIFAIITGLYVIYGGIIAVIYNDALQAGVMFGGMIIVGIITIAVLNDSGTCLGDLWNTYASKSIEDLANKGMTGWTSFPEFGSEVWWTLVSTFMLGVGIGALAQPQLVVRFMAAKDNSSMNRSLVVGSIFIFVIVGIAYTVGAFTNIYFFDEHGLIAIDYVNNVDMIIPTFVTEIFGQYGVVGEIFVALFVLAILTASISTMSALLHTMGAAGSYDILSKIKQIKGKIANEEDYHSLKANRIITAIMLVVVVVVAFVMPSNIIAKATSIFMGLTAATLLPVYAYGIFSKKEKLSKNAAAFSIVIGAVIWVVWGFFINTGIATVIGTPVIVEGIVNFVDPLVIALPLSALALFIGVIIDRKRAIA